VKTRTWKLSFCLVLVLPAACAAPVITRDATLGASEPFCEVGDSLFYTDFESAALHACSRGENGPVLIIAPEYAPINPSPWYAWRVLAPTAAVLTVRQRYLHGRHRYHPWVSRDGIQWSRLPESSVLAEQDGGVEFSLEVPRGGLYVAAQPLLTNTEMERWAQQMATAHGLEARVVAHSAGGRQIMAYASDVALRHGLVVLISRQHPPEVTGGFAFQDFVERLFAADDLAVRFRSRYAMGLVPGVNPDGVARGHWRTNQRGVDLNRDWGPFTQPETRGVADWMAQIHGRVPLRLFMDFHSTWTDVFYLPHASDDPEPAGFSAAWRARLAARLGDAMPGWSGQHNPGLPTAKSWVRKAYGVTAMTYEVADTTPRDRIRLTARAAAEEMMTLMLEIEDDAP
jgi:hypothetical protein